MYAGPTARVECGGLLRPAGASRRSRKSGARDAAVRGVRFGTKVMTLPLACNRKAQRLDLCRVP